MSARCVDAAESVVAYAVRECFSLHSALAKVFELLLGAEALVVAYFGHWTVQLPEALPRYVAYRRIDTRGPEAKSRQNRRSTLISEISIMKSFEYIFSVIGSRPKRYLARAVEVLGC